ncbi:MAG: PIG-L family deacetylase [Armatimonadetes bacterium]|nr:PIG-L family deacetylase [Armatimonadota bacterium]
MELKNPKAEIFVPDGLPADEALARATHMCIGAHPDDVEIMAWRGILECFQQKDKWFAAVIVTDGAGSPRDDLYADYTNEDMIEVRKVEQKKAAFVGEYAASVLLQYPSSAVKDKDNPDVVEDLRTVLELAQPQKVYIHNLADKHATHVASALRSIAAMRQMPADARPQEVYGVEVWRDLDWMCDDDKVCFDVTAHDNLALSLLGIYDSQVCGGKRYDLATMGRRRAHATYQATHEVDVSEGMIFAMDLTPLIKDESLDIAQFVLEHIERFKAEVADNIGGML